MLFSFMGRSQLGEKADKSALQTRMLPLQPCSSDSHPEIMPRIQLSNDSRARGRAKLAKPDHDEGACKLSSRALVAR